MIAGEVYRLARQVYDTALAQGRMSRDMSASTEEYVAAQEAAHDALKALADVIYANFPVSEKREVAS